MQALYHAADKMWSEQILFEVRLEYRRRHNTCYRMTKSAVSFNRNINSNRSKSICHESRNYHIFSPPAKLHGVSAPIVLTKLFPPCSWPSQKHYFHHRLFNIFSALQQHLSFRSDSFGCVKQQVSFVALKARVVACSTGSKAGITIS